jgi:hypothetical protein
MGIGYYGKRAMSNDDVYDSFMNRVVLSYHRSFWPRRCYVTGQWLFCTIAIRGRAIWTGPGTPVLEDRWYHRNEGLMLMLKKESNGIF